MAPTALSRLSSSLLIVTVPLLLVAASFAQEANCQSPPSSNPELNLQISLPSGESTFREGELIPLHLQFTSRAPGQYLASTASYDRSGRLNIDVICLDPH